MSKCLQAWELRIRKSAHYLPHQNGWVETIESLYYPESKNRVSEDSTGFKVDYISEDDIESKEGNMRLGYIGLHYNESELPEADDLLEVITAIEE